MGLEELIRVEESLKQAAKKEPTPEEMRKKKFEALFQLGKDLAQADPHEARHKLESAWMDFLQQEVPQGSWKTR